MQNRYMKEAENLYKDGNDYLNKSYITEELLRAAKACFRKAREADPKHAAAYAAEAEANIWLSIFSWEYPHKMLPEAENLASEALRLDNRLGDAHASYALAILFRHRAWAKAKEEFAQALELSDGKSQGGYRGYALWLMANRQVDKALEMADCALKQKLLAYRNIAVECMVLYEGNKFDEFQQSVMHRILASLIFAELPKTDAIYYILGLFYESQGRFEKAIETIEKVEFNEREFLGHLVLGHIYAKAGHQDKALKLLNKLKEWSEQRWVSPFHIALIEAALSERDQAFKDKAFESLDKAIEGLDPWVLLIDVDPRLAALREDPRFEDRLRHIGLEPHRIELEPTGIEQAVWETLEKTLLVPRSQLNVNSDLVRDLKIDSDDLSFIFVPELEKKLGIKKIPMEEWGKVSIIREVIDLLQRYKDKTV